MVSDSLSGLSLHNSITNSETLIEQEQNCISRQKKEIALYVHISPIPQHCTPASGQINSISAHLQATYNY
jgi:hypothetical protein